LFALLSARSMETALQIGNYGVVGAMDQQHGRVRAPTCSIGEIALNAESL
jgi:hypothetical protein